MGEDSVLVSIAYPAGTVAEVWQGQAYNIILSTIACRKHACFHRRWTGLLLDLCLAGWGTRVEGRPSGRKEPDVWHWQGRHSVAAFRGRPVGVIPDYNPDLVQEAPEKENAFTTGPDLPQRQPTFG